MASSMGITGHQWEYSESHLIHQTTGHFNICWYLDKPTRTRLEVEVSVTLVSPWICVYAEEALSLILYCGHKGFSPVHTDRGQRKRMWCGIDLHTQF